MVGKTRLNIMRTAIIIPARYASTRFPGKPLALLGGQTMLSRVVDIARKAAMQHPNIVVAVATEDARIEAHCREIDVPCVMTSDDCATGSDRVLQAAQKLGDDFDFVLGLQGDAPFTPVVALTSLIEAFRADPALSVVTPVVNLRWEELDTLRENKKTTPFSGTTVTRHASGRALWFSKNIIPSIRKEDRSHEYSPVYQHLGLYGFRYDVLKRFVTLPQGEYEKLEGLEQLRLLENDIPVQTIVLDIDLGVAQAGIDSPEDAERAEQLLARLG